ncbi:TetR family transcriptional regulator [Mycobacterium sp. E1715]|nr:TetR family transcriptional regulator [Mycobacterium sp. E188]OBG61821.1 TetR family transcriptional regulator [Mycobacterium sp. E735]OBG91031.1 TetR family transcriptional regulator [Mycobacterium sp. E3298]OBH32212.1 TetR family transcriptional regulator [Mycobacterium sp. E1715]OBH43840.1 TetR family transcriptional regulator [Mycobacterium sp. E183]
MVSPSADATRRQIIRAASQQFARRPYHEVGLDDILAEAGLTKGALYFHFTSKHALALAMIDEQTAAVPLALHGLQTRGLSGLETLIDFSFLVAVQDLKSDLFRAALNLVETVGQSEARHQNLFGQWIKALAAIVEQAIAEGDIDDDCAPEDLARMMLSAHMGLRKTSSLDEPERFLHDLQKCWTLLLNGILQPDRNEYFAQFLRRRTALAVQQTPTPDKAG